MSSASLHLVKLSVGTQSVENFEGWVKRRTAFNKKRGLGSVHDHETRMFPKRGDELLAGGSLYWVIKGVILVRQKLLDLQDFTDVDGIKKCRIVLDPPVIPTEAQGKRAFQGWRYLPASDAPDDLSNRRDGGAGAPPPALRAQLAELGLL